MASGKSTIGRALARKLGLPFVDTDEEIERRFGSTISEIFERRGEAEFRRAERETVLRLLAGPPQVISLGGGACEDGATRRALTERAATAWLDPPFETILERLGRSDKRPLALGRSPEDLRRLFEKRREGYSVADLRVVTSDEEPSLAADRIATMLASPATDRKL